MPFPLALSWLFPSEKDFMMAAIQKSISKIKIKEATAEISCLDGTRHYKKLRSKVVFVGKTQCLVVLDPATLVDAEITTKEGVFITDSFFISKKAISMWQIVDSKVQDLEVTDVLLE